MDMSLLNGDYYILSGRRVYKIDLYSELETFRQQKIREFKAYEQEMLKKLSALRGEHGNGTQKLQENEQDDNER